MTKAQHQATKALEAAERVWLQAYGWVHTGVAWEHPKVGQRMGLRDAVATTRANPLIGHL